MEVDVVPFRGRLMTAAAVLLADRHEATGEHPGALDLSDVKVAAHLVETWQNTGPAVAAMRDDILVGFMAATLAKPPGHQVARIRIHQHAATPSDTRTIYRHLYAAMSGQLVAAGDFEHTIVVSTDHHNTVNCLFELGFGVDQIKGLRYLTPPAATARGVRVRPARSDDVAELLKLTVELQHFHAEPPILRPALVDLRAISDSFHEALTDERQLLLVAEDHGRLLGMMQAGPDNRHRDTATIGLAVVTASARSQGTGTALLSAVLNWAEAHGFQACGAQWSSANLVSDAFWRGHGFSPVRYTLTRLTDARVAWADARLNYEHLFPELYATTRH